MNRRDKYIWSNSAPKPKGFSFVKGQLLTYTYEVVITESDNGLYHWNAKDLDKIYIKVKHVNGLYGHCIDNEKTNEYIKEEIGHNIEFKFDETQFTRDRSLFPFICSINIDSKDVEKYKQYRLLKARREKISKLKNKLI
jgi:hypothetical protein